MGVLDIFKDKENREELTKLASEIAHDISKKDKKEVDKEIKENKKSLLNKNILNDKTLRFSQKVKIQKLQNKKR